MDDENASNTEREKIKFFSSYENSSRYETCRNRSNFENHPNNFNNFESGIFLKQILWKKLWYTQYFLPLIDGNINYE